LGIYFSYHSLNDNFINALRKGRKQNVIIIHGEDVKLLFKEEINLKDFLTYAIEKLSFDNLTHISVKEFIKYTSNSKKSVKISVDDSKIKDFIKSNITVKKKVDTIDLEIELDKLSSDEKAKTYLILFKHSKKILNISFPLSDSYINAKRFFSFYEPDFNNDVLKDLPNEYYSKYIFDDTNIYLLNFIDNFIDEFPNISQDSKNVFEKNIIDLYKRSDWEGENALTYILEKHEKLFSKDILKEMHKLYINFYYSSSREDRFPQKTYAIQLVKDNKLNKETVFEWVEEKLIYDLELYENRKEFYG